MMVNTSFLTLQHPETPIILGVAEFIKKTAQMRRLIRKGNSDPAGFAGTSHSFINA